MKKRLLSCIKSGTQSALKTIWWLAKIMVGVSFLIMMLQYIGVIQWISYWLTPIFSHIGLPGEAAIAYVTGYFVNCYSAMAVISTLSLNWRAVTIISVMVLCSHNMVVETAVQHVQRLLTQLRHLRIVRDLAPQDVLNGNPTTFREERPEQCGKATAKSVSVSLHKVHDMEDGRTLDIRP